MLPEEYADIEHLRETIAEHLRQLDDAGTNHLNLTDPDARLIKSKHGVEFCYNDQITVDSAHGIITANGVSQDAMDSRNLTPMLDEVAETTGRCADENLANSGYYSGKALADADEKGREVLVNKKPTPSRSAEKQDEFDVENFDYDEESDRYYCGYGGWLVFRSKRWDKKKGYYRKYYKCQEYANCPFREQCSPKGCRTISVSEFRKSISRQREKQKKPVNVELLKSRKTIVEPVFGNIKHNMGFRRFTVRGIDEVSAQWALICLIVNLKKIYRVWAARI